MPIKSDSYYDSCTTNIPVTVSPFDDQQQQTERTNLNITKESLMTHNQEYLVRHVDPLASLYYLQNIWPPSSFVMYSQTQSPASSASDWSPHDLSLKRTSPSSVSASERLTIGQEDNCSNPAQQQQQRTAQLTFTPDCAIYDESFQRILRCLSTEERKSLDDLLNLLAHRIHSIADPAPSFPIDPRPLSVKQLRKFIPLLRMYAYPTPGPIPQRQKIKHIWEEKPADWPNDIIFRDPNNNRKGGKKPSKSELVKMYYFLYARHKQHERNASSTPATVATSTSTGQACDAAVPSIDFPSFNANQFGDSWLTSVTSHHAGTVDSRADDEEEDEEESSDDEEDEGRLTIACDNDEAVKSSLPTNDVTKSDMDIKGEAVDLKSCAIKCEQETATAAAVNTVRHENENSSNQQQTSTLLGKRKFSSSSTTSASVPVSKKNRILQRWQDYNSD